MTPQKAIRISLDMAEYVCMGYLNDLTDAELFRRASEGINHINWQIGHLIESEHRMMEGFNPKQPALPAGFAEQYSREKVGCDDPTQFSNKQTLLDTYRSQRTATLEFLETTSDDQLDQDTGIEYAPTLADLISMQGSHWLMHAGQWVVVRRQLGRQPLF